MDMRIRSIVLKNLLTNAAIVNAVHVLIVEHSCCFVFVIIHKPLFDFKYELCTLW